jgi:hypothetical protein
MQGARKVALEKEAELARQEQELTRREAAVNAKRDLFKTLGGVSVTSKRQKAPPPKIGVERNPMHSNKSIGPAPTLGP